MNERIRAIKSGGIQSMTTPVALSTLLALLALFMLTGCPTYKDAYSGQYQEIELDELQDEAVTLDLFRFGDDVRAILRRYSIASASARENPFAPENQIACHWTRVDAFREGNRSFSLTVPATARQGRIDLQGVFDEDGMLDLDILQEESEEPRSIRLESNGVAPDSNCVNIDDFLLRAVFDDGGANELDRDVYELRHPVFALLWVGVESVVRDGFRVDVPTNIPEPAVRLRSGAEFLPHRNGLSSNLSVSVPVPPDRILMDSGTTRFALAHFIVIDDAEEEGSFTWNVSDEPIVATALERAEPGDLPEELEGQQIDRWGRALLFVEGRLDELDPELDQDLLFRLSGLSQAEPDRHFYIVDIFSYNEDVKILRLPPRPQPGRPVQRRVSLQVTEEYLEASRVNVPRLYPQN